MKSLTKTIIRTWITLMSFLAFAVGWIGLSMSGTPSTQAADSGTVHTVDLGPVPSVEQLVQNGQNSNLNPGFTIVASAPRLRTSGS